MKLSEHLQSRASILGELLQFFWERKWWWLTPMLLLLLLVGGLIIFAQSSAIAPFIYPLVSAGRRGDPAGTESLPARPHAAV